AAELARDAIQVEYEKYPVIFDPEKSIDNPVIIHPEIKNDPILFDPKKNIASRITANIGDVKTAASKCDHIFEREYSTPYAQHAHIEPHITLTWIDENERLIIRTATQVPFHVRRIVSEVLAFPISRIRVIKPRIGGGFGSKQEILNEEICAAITLKTGRPARIELTRKEEFFAARSRHPQRIKIKMGVDRNFKINFIDMKILENCGAYGPHALTVMSVTSQKTLSLYKIPNIRLHGDAVYTNLPIAGAYRGYGAPQGFFALESMIDEIADNLKIDPIQFRLDNFFQPGDEIPIARILGEGREGFEMILNTTGIKECLNRGKKLIGWKNKEISQVDNIKIGYGVAAVCQGSGIPGIDMASAFIKMNEDGSFNLQVGATDLGTGSDTALAQIASEVLEVSIDRIIVYSSDTDMTPFDTGAYASSTTFISGGAVKKASEKLKAQILDQGKRILNDEECTVSEGIVKSMSGKSVTYSEICTKSFYTDHQRQLMASASHTSFESPLPFNATFAKVAVNVDTGEVKVHTIVSVTDAGQIINPQMAEGQVEGAIPQSLGMALSEFMIFDKNGDTINTDFSKYHIYTSVDMPKIISEFVHTNEPSGPFGAKAVAEIPINGPAPAVANAIFNACGVRIRHLPITPEKIVRGLNRI
ncbi:MAG: xanthine dehydrogenase family protein molybdopterin-binding subunit, partial [Fidelibacterota bacterium]